jgi:hypothetical protein
LLLHRRVIHLRLSQQDIVCRLTLLRRQVQPGHEGGQVGFEPSRPVLLLEVQHWRGERVGAALTGLLGKLRPQLLGLKIRFARQLREDRLRDIFGHRPVTVHLSQRRRIDQVQVLPH